MMQRAPSWLILCFVLAAASLSSADDESSVQEEVVDGQGHVVGVIDWTAGSVTARGEADTHEKAIVAARDTLYQVLLTMPVDAGSSVGDRVRRHPGMTRALADVVRSAPVTFSTTKETVHRAYVRAPLLGLDGVLAVLLRPPPPDSAAITPTFATPAAAPHATVGQPGVPPAAAAPVPSPTPTARPAAHPATTAPAAPKPTHATGASTPARPANRSEKAQPSAPKLGAKPPTSDAKPRPAAPPANVDKPVAAVAPKPTPKPTPKPSAPKPVVRRPTPPIRPVPKPPAPQTTLRPPPSRQPARLPDKAQPSPPPTPPPAPRQPRLAPLNTPESGPFSGLLIDARGLGLKRCISPLVMTESGKILYGRMPKLTPAQLDEIRRSGIVSFLSDAADIPKARSGKRPLAIRAVRVHGRYSGNPIISDADGERILQEDKRDGFLKRMAVSFLLR